MPSRKEKGESQTTETTLIIMGGTSLAGKVTRFLASRRQDSLEFVYSEDQRPNSDTSVGDVEFEFLDDGELLLGQSASSDECNNHPNNEMDLDEEDEAEKDHGGNVEANRSFWDNQHQVLQVN